MVGETCLLNLGPIGVGNETCLPNLGSIGVRPKEDSLGTILGPLKAILEPLEAILGPLEAILGAQEPQKRAWRLDGVHILIFTRVCRSPTLGAILEPSWGHSGAILGPFWGHLGASWGCLGFVGTLFGPSRGVLEAS